MTALDLSPETLNQYRPLAAIRRRRSAAAKISMANRRRRAMQMAHKAAGLLCNKLGTQEGMVFRSQARCGGFIPWSEIDLAAKGIPSTRFYGAVGLLTGISAEFKIDPVDLGSCVPPLRNKMKQRERPSNAERF